MLISELKGYKQNDHYKSSKEFFHGDLSNTNARIDRLIEFQRYMVNNGFNPVGASGQGGTAFEHPSYPWVFKIFTHDKAYMDFFHYAKAHQSNPLIPKIKGNVIKINDNTFVVRIEKLFPVMRGGHINSMIKIAGSVQDIDDIEYYNKHDPGRIESLQTGAPELYSLMMDLLNTFPNHTLDMHRGNIMQRDNGELVVIDPLV